MDLYTRTALTDSRHHDLLTEADANRLAANGRPAGTTLVARVSDRVASIVGHARSAQVARPEPRKAGAHS